MTVKEIKLSGKSKDFTWYKELFDANKLYVGSSKLNDTTFEHFRTAIKCTIDIYDDNWDIDFRLSGDNVIVHGIVIHFPDVTIRNSREKKHNIKDLFVRIPLQTTEKSLRVNRLEGGRTTFTKAEYDSNYYHSHLNNSAPSSSGTAPYFNSFCTGSGEINIHELAINSDGFTEKSFIQYLLAIVTLVNWESLEGTPYREMTSIRERSQSNTYNYHIGIMTSYKTLFLRKIKSLTKPNIDVDIYIEAYGYKIRNNEKFLKFLTQIPLDDREKTSYLCFVAENGQAYKYSSSGTLSGSGSTLPSFTGDNSVFIYNKKEYRTIIITKKEEKEVEVEFRLHPNLVEQIKTEFEYELNKTAIRESTINKYTSKTSDARESVASDQISVQADS